MLSRQPLRGACLRATSRKYTSVRFSVDPRAKSRSDHRALVLSLDRDPLGTIDGMSSLFDSSRGSFRVVMADLVGAVVLAAATAGAWWAWLGRDTTYQVDRRTGVTSGPYEQFQVVGCVLTLLLLAVLGAILLPFWLMPVVMTACFTIC
jgi:hypothetical protein